MFPAMPQRLLIAAAFIVGLAGMLLVLPALKPGDLSSGISLVDDGSAANVRALGFLALAALPVVLAGIIVSATGNPLSGVFAGAAALLVLACRGGSITGWIFRHERLPDDYRGLIVEALVYAIGLAVVLRLHQFFRPRLRPRLPALLVSRHFGLPAHTDKAPPPPPPHRGPILTALFGPPHAAKLAGDLSSQLGALAVCLAAGGAFSYLLLRSPQTGQVVCGLMVAFALAGLISHLLFPHADPLPILLAPLLVAAIGYVWVLISYAGAPSLHAGLFSRTLPGLAMALPIHFASAGVAGAALGLGWGQGFLTPDDEPDDQLAVDAGE